MSTKCQVQRQAKTAIKFIQRGIHDSKHAYVQKADISNMSRKLICVEKQTNSISRNRLPQVNIFSSLTTEVTVWYFSEGSAATDLRGSDSFNSRFLCRFFWINGEKNYNNLTTFAIEVLPLGVR